MHRVRHFCPVFGLYALIVLLGSPTAAEPAQPDFSRDIQPILSNNCFKCHGPDAKERQASLRFDDRAVALKPAESGKIAIVPGKPADSELVARIYSADRDKLMPPPDSGKTLSAPQQDLLKRWIAAGAEYSRHWSYVKPAKPAPPVVKAASKTAIDAFLLAKLNEQKLAPAAAADKATLLRRLSLDLTGLPPTPDDVDAFVKDKSADAFNHQIDRLLASPHYGERMALYWLDLVRYGDTAGYHSDNARDVWLYRDYVIDAFNANKRFDQFTTEQLAGDLLPNKTNEQRIASGYNRMLMTTEEGGAQSKEYTAKYAADRVRNVSVAWLGLTMGCCECHDHKYDPFTSRDFYRLAAFFSDVQEKPVGRQDQTSISTPEAEQELADLDAAIKAAQAALDEEAKPFDEKFPDWEAELAKPDYAGEKPPKAIADLLSVPIDQRDPIQKKTLRDHHRGQVAELKPAREKVIKAIADKAERQKGIPTTLVSMSGKPRTTRILPRGNWLDETGDVVTPGTPAYVTAGEPKPETKDGRATRLDLAKWIVDSENPLTARVFVNRVWKLLFGYGLVRTSEDFGMQGERPTHPELLDWLACDFVEHDWDVKRLVRMIVSSDAYRRSSVPTAEQKQIDPANLWLARQNRFRLDAEFVRDNALAISGLLTTKVGGPSVKPYQPAGYWAYLNFPARDWTADSGENQYRRGMYTFWQRTFPHPMMLAFDAPSREECTAERPRANIPQQALVLLNDPTFVEAGRAFAQQMIQHGGETPTDRIAWSFRRALSRPPSGEEAKILSALFEKHKQQYHDDKKAVDQILGVGQAPIAKDVDRAELAAWTSVARAILNLHETVTRN